MTTHALKLLSAAVVDRLASDISINLERYISGSFNDLSQQSGWEIETSLAHWDLGIAHMLDPTIGAEAEIKNSLLIYNGLVGMTPALAREERLWTRLCHVDCLEYCRQRWLRGTDNLPNLVRLHFFAPGLVGCRDDNAIGRLWWNGHIASLASPSDLEGGLRLLLSWANIRLQIVDRADSAFRQPLVQGIFRLLSSESWFDTDDAAIARFMLEVNKRSGSIVFEALAEATVDEHLAICLDYAKQRTA